MFPKSVSIKGVSGLFQKANILQTTTETHDGGQLSVDR